MTARQPAGWLVISAPAPPPAESFLMVDGLRRLGARAVERDGDRVTAWVADPTTDSTAPAEAVTDFVREARAMLRSNTSLAEPAITWEWRTHEEWVARWARELTAPPRRVSERIVVAPTGAQVEAGVAGSADVVIRLEPGPAFGNAEHATTRGCLRLLERIVIVRAGQGSAQGLGRVVDVGTGTGVLAIAAALMGAHDVLALEADALSCDSARRNVAANGVADRVHVRRLTVSAEELYRLAAADVVLANIEASILLPLLSGLGAVIGPAGTLIVAGVTGGERDALMRAATSAGLELRAGEVVDGWPCVALAARKSSR